MEDDIIDEKYENLKKEITAILNKYSLENRSDTPDYMLADFMLGCLTVYENTVRNNKDKKEIYSNGSFLNNQNI